MSNYIEFCRILSKSVEFCRSLSKSIVEMAKKGGDVPETVTVDIPDDEYNPEPEPAAGGDDWGDDDEW